MTMTDTTLASQSNANPQAESELRVLSGQLEGARIPIADGEELRIGRQLRNDVILRDPDWKDTRLRFRREGHAASIDVITGQVELLGQTIDGPARLTLPSYTPLSVGKTTIAFGPPREDDWARCEALRNFAVMPIGASEIEAIDPEEHAEAAVPAQPASRFGGRLNHRVAAGLVACAALALFATGISMATDRKTADDHYARASSLVASLGLSQIDVKTTDAGGLVIDGYVETDAELAQLSQAVHTEAIEAELSVTSGDAVADRIGRVASLLGLTVEIENMGEQVFTASGVMEREDSIVLQNTAISEIDGIKRLNVNIVGYPEEVRPVIKARAGDEILIVERFENGNGYIETRDGRRIMKGGLLPDGTQIVKFADDGIHLKRDGKRIIQPYADVY